jgi:very-short-patch-repair endonuclease
MPELPTSRIRGVHQEVQQAAETLRRDMTRAERLLWMGLRRYGAGGRFRRQHPVGPFILDFCCPALRLVIELDGAVHDDPARTRRDVARTAWLQAQGYRVHRFRNEEVMRDGQHVLECIAALVGTLQREGKGNGTE